jgi:cytochrome P450
MAGNHPPVTDWTTDFDHTDEVWAADPYPIWADIRASECPVVHSDRYGGVWLPTRHEDVSAIAYDTEHFTSQSPIVSEGRPMMPAPQGIAPPISSDPPFHHDARRLLLPAFSPRAVEELEPFTRAFCNDLLDQVEGQDVVDAAVEYAQHIPVQVIAKMLGFPAEDADIFRTIIHNALESVDLPVEKRIENFGLLDNYLRAQIEDHIANPRDDLTNYLLSAEMGGEPLNEEHVGGTMALLLIAGIDTTWSGIGASLWHLAKTPSDRQRLAAEPGLLPLAIEEFLRAYAPVTMARLVKDDFDFNGCPMKANEWVLLPFPAANRDPEVFENPDEVIIDREVNRHAAFGLGIHRCAGSNLARMEMQVAVDVWMQRYGSDFSLADPDAVTWSGGQVRGPRMLPVRIG